MFAECDEALLKLCLGNCFRFVGILHDAFLDRDAHPFGFDESDHVTVSEIVMRHKLVPGAPHFLRRHREQIRDYQLRSHRNALNCFNRNSIAKRASFGIGSHRVPRVKPVF